MCTTGLSGDQCYFTSDCPTDLPDVMVSLGYGAVNVTIKGNSLTTTSGGKCYVNVVGKTEVFSNEEDEVLLYVLGQQFFANLYVQFNFDDITILLGSREDNTNVTLTGALQSIATSVLFACLTFVSLLY